MAFLRFTLPDEGNERLHLVRTASALKNDLSRTYTGFVSGDSRIYATFIPPENTGGRVLFGRAGGKLQGRWCRHTRPPDGLCDHSGPPPPLNLLQIESSRTTAGSVANSVERPRVKPVCRRSSNRSLSIRTTNAMLDSLVFKILHSDSSRPKLHLLHLFSDQSGESKRHDAYDQRG